MIRRILLHTQLWSARSDLHHYERKWRKYGWPHHLHAMARAADEVDRLTRKLKKAPPDKPTAEQEATFLNR